MWQWRHSFYVKQKAFHHYSSLFETLWELLSFMLCSYRVEIKRDQNRQHTPSTEQNTKNSSSGVKCAHALWANKNVEYENWIVIRLVLGWSAIRLLIHATTVRSCTANKTIEVRSGEGKRERSGGYKGKKRERARISYRKREFFIPSFS